MNMGFLNMGVISVDVGRCSYAFEIQQSIFVDSDAQKLHDTGKNEENWCFQTFFFIFSEYLRIFCLNGFTLLGKGKVHRVTQFKTNKKEN